MIFPVRLWSARNLDIAPPRYAAGGKHGLPTRGQKSTSKDWKRSKGENHMKVFLLSNCELKAAAPSENTSAGWWIRSPSLQRLAMEGRGWHKAAAERGAKLRPDMQRGKVYQNVA